MVPLQLHPACSTYHFAWLVGAQSTLIVSIMRITSLVISFLFFLPLYTCQFKPRTLEGDTRVNSLFSQKTKSGGFVQLDPHTELVAEDPPGSGR